MKILDIFLELLTVRARAILMKPRTAFLLVFISTSLNSAFAGPPVITNVVASQRTGTKLVDIHYDVADADGDPLKIRIEISNNGGTTYSVPANSITGDVGTGIAPGQNKLIVWNAGIDWDGEFSETMRVKVIASDGKGFPGLEWGQEIPPGGFFIGKDGGPEGIGTGRHVNIPWSYWLSKYEITVDQFTEFMNAALAAGEITRSGNEIYSTQGAFPGLAANTQLYSSSQSGDTSWVLNKFIPTTGRENLPAVVYWAGAWAFAFHYGYDLPTDAEWEKAARGPDHDGLGEHWVYPWGNGINGYDGSFRASENPLSGRRTPVGFFKGPQSPGGLDMGNAYGLYDLIGNVAEWTRTQFIELESYPAVESLGNAIHAYDRGGTRVLRGGSYEDSVGAEQLKCYFRNTSSPWSGFRVVRRAQP
jgi:formylglycine-generating enzyme required for sulfatase activity